MTRSQLIDALSSRLHLDRATAEAVVRAVFGAVEEALRRGEHVELRGFGSFDVRRRRPRSGRNPRTGERVEVPGRRSPFFRVGKILRARVERSAAGGRKRRDA